MSALLSTWLSCDTISIIPFGNVSNGTVDTSLGQQGYVVISGDECISYGGAMSVSLYDILTGEKIK